jgi:triacylglycerol esterase/lipase EstA (alpha/beta hydrolase family)
MTAVFLFVLVFGGAVAYVGWAARCVAQGAAAWWFVAGAPIAYLALPLFLTMLWFAVAWIWRTPRAAEAQLGFAGSIRLYVGELMAVAISWPLMALHRVLIRDPAPAPATLPAVLVHGVLTNDGVWFMLRRHLARRGIGPVYTVNYGPPHADIERFAGQLAAKIDAVCAATGAARVVLVGHSMGGLVARAYLRRFGGERVARLVTLGAPHHGSVLAWTFFGTCLAQMRPGNAWLAALNEHEAEPAPVPIASIWSRHDSMVVPQVSSVLGCAENIALTGLGHNALLDDPVVHRLIAGLLDGEKASPGTSF